MVYTSWDVVARVLFLDDNPYRCLAATRTFVGGDLYITHTVQGTIHLLETTGSFGFVTLDHDLNGEEYVNSSRPDCGMEVARWIVTNKPTIGKINVHSWNNDAADKMVDILGSAGYQVERRRFGDSGFVE